MVHHLLMSNKKFVDTINTLAAKKPYDKILLKACEELNELSTRLLQYVNNHKKIHAIKIAEEIVDAQMNIILLCKVYDNIDFSTIVEDKVVKMICSKDVKKYKHK